MEDLEHRPSKVTAVDSHSALCTSFPMPTTRIAPSIRTSRVRSRDLGPVLTLDVRILGAIRAGERKAYGTDGSDGLMDPVQETVADHTYNSTTVVVIHSQVIWDYAPVTGLSSTESGLRQRLQDQQYGESQGLFPTPLSSTSSAQKPNNNTDRSGDSNGFIDNHQSNLRVPSDLNHQPPSSRQQPLVPSPRQSSSIYTSRPPDDQLTVSLGIPTHSDPLVSATASSQLPGLQPRRSSRTSSSSPRISSQAVSPPISVSGENGVYLKVSTECLHAQDYNKMVQTLSLVRLDEDTDLEIVGAVEFGKGLAYYKLKKYSAAIKHFQAMEESGKRQREAGKGNVFLANYYLGEIDMLRTHHDKAIDHYSRAAASYNRVTVAALFRVVIPSLSSVQAKLASALRNVSNVMAAVQAYRNAIAAADSKKDELSARTSLGNLYQSLGENASALTEYEAAIKLAEELEDYVSLGWAHGNIGNAYLGLYQKDKAIFHLSKSLDLAVEHEPTAQSIGRAYNNLGTAYQALNDLENARTHYDLALSQAIYGNDIAGQARVYGNIGNLLMIEGKYAHAIRHYTEALAITTDRNTRSTAYHNRGCASYEKAEKDRKALVERLASDGRQIRGMSDITYLGEGFEDIDPQHLPMLLPDSILKQYTQARKDLVRVVSDHETTFLTIKGSSKGLTLSVSLFESNSRTFHRLQDSLYCLGEWKDALAYAEQSRARSLGELLLQKNSHHLHLRFTPPLTVDQILAVVRDQQSDIVFLSYTGVRLLGWVLVPFQDSVSFHMFQVALKDDQFEGKSFDYYLRYSLTEILVENNIEMYKSSRYDEPSPVAMLYDLVAEPILRVLKHVHGDGERWESRDVVLIPDSYTNLIPMVALLHTNRETNRLEFLGDKLRFRTMPSLLTMGIMDQLPSVNVRIPEDSRYFCIIGNPTIPTFKYQGEKWNLGKLPFATEEAEWVSHILKCSPTLHEQATKPVALSMFMNAKVIHIATHGSATAGFLAFAGMGSTRGRDPVDEDTVLIYPADVEHLNISPALVVLSSCDSGRGTVKADGIIGMARAFILAGAQAVLTTLWRVPDESACIFMQFFFQYLMDGLRSSIALQKAILSLRCFVKYSGFIHWTGYQLTGREIQFTVRTHPKDDLVRKQVGPCAIFPRLDMVKKLEKAFIGDPPQPTDVQLIQGSHGLKPSEPVINFISKFHAHFTGGIYWYNGTNAQLIKAATENIRKVVPDAAPSDRPVLVVFDNILSLPSAEALTPLQLRNYNTHIIVCTNSLLHADTLRQEIDQQLVRGCVVTPMKPLTGLHTTQRLAHSILKDKHFTPFNSDQEALAYLAEATCGSPALVDIAIALLKVCSEECEDGGLLEEFFDRLELLEAEAPPPPPPPSKDPTTGAALPPTVSPEHEKEVEEEKWEELVSETELERDKLTGFTSKLIKAIDLDPSEYFLLTLLSVFGPVPIPRAVAEVGQSLILTAKYGLHSRDGHYNLLARLQTVRLLRAYPAAVIAPPGSASPLPDTSGSAPTKSYKTEEEFPFIYIPQMVSDALWADMNNIDKVFCISSAYKTLLQFNKLSLREDTRVGLHFAAGLAEVLVSRCDDNYDIIGVDCYKEVFRLNINYRMKVLGPKTSTAQQ